MVGYDLGVPVVDDLAAVIDDCDVSIDFSTKEMTMDVLKLAIEHKRSLQGKREPLVITRFVQVNPKQPHCLLRSHGRAS